LAEKFDMVVIDHPWAGYSFRRGLFHDLAPLLSEQIKTELRTCSVGPSYESYMYEGKLLAIPIDAATPSPSWRADLMQEAGKQPPTHWSELVALARKRLAILPGFAPDLFLHFHMLVDALGGTLYLDPETFCDEEQGVMALELLRELTEFMPREIFDWNPIRVAEILSNSDAYCLSAFGYTYGNYSRPGFARHRLEYGSLPRLDNGALLRSIVGGTGIAFSKRLAPSALEIAINYGLFTGSSSMQRTLYTAAGGQPSRVEAWDDLEADRISGGFLSSARADMNHCLIRPRYDGYVALQETGGRPIQTFLLKESSAREALDAIRRAFRASLPPECFPEL
jgi:multiple sugar transport system substrate-binding protein